MCALPPEADIHENDGYARDRHFGGFWDWLTTALNPNYPTYTGTGWGIFGAIVGAAVIYMVQLMRR
jgi:hypothetical protein